MRTETTNPRFFPGNVSGLGMQKEENGRVVDTRYGVHIDYTDGCLLRHPLDEVTIAYAVDGLLEGTPDRIRSLFLLSPAITAHVVAELTSLLLRADPDAAAAMIARLSDLIPPAQEPQMAQQEAQEQPAPPPQTDTLIMSADPGNDRAAA